MGTGDAWRCVSAAGEAMFSEARIDDVREAENDNGGLDEFALLQIQYLCIHIPDASSLSKNHFLRHLSMLLSASSFMITKIALGPIVVRRIACYGPWFSDEILFTRPNLPVQSQDAKHHTLYFTR